MVGGLGYVPGVCWKILRMLFLSEGRIDQKSGEWIDGLVNGLMDGVWNPSLKQKKAPENQSFLHTKFERILDGLVLGANWLLVSGSVRLI